jgi:hypothetical protein
MNKAAESNPARVRDFDGPSPLEARDALVTLIRAREPREQIERAADTYIRAIRERARATKRRLPVPTRAAIIRLLS